MKKETVYLDTSVISAYFDNRVIERKKITVDFWHNVLPNYHVLISEITKEELHNATDNALRKKMNALIKDLKILKLNKNISILASAYIKNNIFPERYFDDALHVATATYNEIYYLSSWNFKHLVKVKTRKYVNSINILNGYKEIEIISPQEL